MRHDFPSEKRRQQNTKHRAQARVVFRCLLNSSWQGEDEGFHKNFTCVLATNLLKKQGVHTFSTQNSPDPTRPPEIFKKKNL